MTQRAESDPIVAARHLGLTALTVLFGVQCLRVLLPLLVFVLQDRFRWSLVAVGLLAFGIFATGLLSVGFQRALRPASFLFLAAGGVGLLRLGLQLWQGDPLVDLCLALGGVALWLVFIPSQLNDRTAGAASRLVLGWLLGLAADTALHSAYGTYDMVWRSDRWTAVALAALVAAQWGLLAKAAFGVTEGSREVGVLAPAIGWPWVAIGPFLFFELLVHGNVARLTTLTGWSPELAAGGVLGGRLIAALAIIHWASRPVKRWAVAAVAVVLMVSTLTPWPEGGVAVALLLASQVAAAGLLAVVVRGLMEGPASPGSRRLLSIEHGLGLLMLASLLFLYYGSFNIRLPFPKEILLPVAAGVMGSAALAAVRQPLAVVRQPLAVVRQPLATVAFRGVRRSWVVIALLALMPLGRGLSAPRVSAEVADGLPLRLMTYNLHCGFDPWGDLDLEAIARVIEAEQPDVVALQEVPRGWVINGSVDAITWLSRRLGMVYAFAGTADPLWGNAILSRRPILDAQAFDLPPGELLLRRGFLVARFDFGGGRELQVIDTHFHHPGAGSAVRELQSRAILDHWGGRERTAILGDLNATPGDPEIEMLRREGLNDVAAVAGFAAGSEAGNTYPSQAPAWRIDYIWTSPDLTSSEVMVPRALASDHLPVVVTLAPR